MKRDFLSVVRFMLLVVFACLALAIAAKMFGATSSTPAWAALHNPPAVPYHNVIVVATSGGDFYEVQKALNSITDNSSTNRYLVWVAPGTYSEKVTMKPYVDIEGAGEGVTRIVNTGSSNSATVFGASNAELRYLTVESTNSALTTAIRNANASPSLLHVTAITSLGTFSASPDTKGSAPDIWQSYGIRNTDGSSPVMTDMTISNTVGSYALCYGVGNESNSSPTMRNVNISVTGYAIASMGVYNLNSSTTMKDVTISASQYSVYNQSTTPGNYSVIIDTSTLRGDTGTILNGQYYVTRVGASKLEGGPTGPYVTCAGVYDENYVFFPNTCP